MEYIKFVVDNWAALVAFVCVIILAVQRILEFIALPTTKKKEEIKNRLLEWVREAEAELGSETGKFKLAQVYDKFCEQYPEIKKWFTLVEFNELVGDALKEMQEAFKNDRVKTNALGMEKVKGSV